MSDRCPRCNQYYKQHSQPGGTSIQWCGCDDKDTRLFKCTCSAHTLVEWTAYTQLKAERDAMASILRESLEAQDIMRATGILCIPDNWTERVKKVLGEK